MGLMLSVIVFCVGVAEVLDCWRHFLLHIVQPQYNPLPYHLNSKTDVRNERELTLVTESRRTSNVDICWPKDLSPNDDLHVIRKRTHSESDRNLAHDVESPSHHSTVRIEKHEEESDTIAASTRRKVLASPQITINDLDPSDQLRVESPLIRTELSPDHLNLDVIVESDSSSELEEPSQIENLAYKRKLEESLKSISKQSDSTEETGEISKITEQSCNNTINKQPPRPSCPSSLGKEYVSEDAEVTDESELEPAVLPEFTGTILSSEVYQVPCRYSERASSLETTNNHPCTEENSELSNQINEGDQNLCKLEQKKKDKSDNLTSKLDSPPNVQSVKSILDEGLDPIPEFPEIRVQESSPVQVPDSSDSSLNTSDASWLAKGKTSDRPLIIRLPQFKDIGVENEKSSDCIKRKESDKDIYYDAEEHQYVEPSNVNSSIVYNIEENLPHSSMGLDCEGVMQFGKEQSIERSTGLDKNSGSSFEKGGISFGECVINSDRQHDLQRETNSSSSSLSGIPQLPEDVKDYSTTTSLPTNNGFHIENNDLLYYESVNNNSSQSSLDHSQVVEESCSSIIEDHQRIEDDNEVKYLETDGENEVLSVEKHLSDEGNGKVCTNEMIIVTCDVANVVAPKETVLPMLSTVSADNSSKESLPTSVTDTDSKMQTNLSKKSMCLENEAGEEGLCDKKHVDHDGGTKDKIVTNKNDSTTKSDSTDLVAVNEPDVPGSSTRCTYSLQKEHHTASGTEIDSVTPDSTTKKVITALENEMKCEKSEISKQDHSILKGDNADILSPINETQSNEIPSTDTSIDKTSQKISVEAYNKSSPLNTKKDNNTEQNPTNVSKGAVPKVKPKQKPNMDHVPAKSKGDAEVKANNVTSDSSNLQKSYVISDHPGPSTSSNFSGIEAKSGAVDEENKATWLIFSGEYTKAMNKDWHSGHFCCWQCDETLTGQRYVLRDEHPYCIKCYETVFANGCEECNKTIGIDSKDLSYKDKHWHEACFLCNKCRVSLVDKQFGSKLDKIFCGNCYDAQFASRCDGCGNIFKAGTKKMEYKTRQWHEPCFSCCVCKSPIGTKSFIPREQEIYCATCYEEKFATRCVKCDKIITSGGVTYKNEPWHRECFTCTNCNTSLAGQRFTSRDEKPYCAECFGELFAKRCTACCKPITGIGGTRFISFEDRHWHNDCFICASCKSSLVGRGFITDAEDIICPECAKQKLM